MVKFMDGDDEFALLCQNCLAGGITFQSGGADME
jgi:hypothetical protein